MVRAAGLAVALSALFAAPSAFAATAELAPASASVSVGDTFTLTLYANSDQAINAITASLSFPTDLLSVVSLNKTTSAFTLWVQEPNYSNSAGTIDLSGIVPDPGVTGRARALVIKLRAKGAGTATVRFASAATLANDGQGTNILSGTVPATITISPASAQPAQTQPAPTQPAPQSAEASPAAAPVLSAPVILRYTRLLRELEPVVISGTTAYPGATVTVHIATGGTETTGSAIADSQGNFLFVQQDGLSAGEYTAYADVAQSGSQSGVSNIVKMQVVQDGHTMIIGFSVPVSWLLMALALLLVLLIALLLYGYLRIRKLKRRMDRHLHDVEASLNYATRERKHRARSTHVKGVLEDMKDRIESTLSQLHEDL